MNKKIILAALPVLILTPFLSGCSGCSSIEHSEEVTADITAAQIEGRRAARKLIHLQWKDSTELKNEYKRIKLYRDSVFPDNKAEFDSTFISTIRIVKPSIATSITKGEL